MEVFFLFFSFLVLFILVLIVISHKYLFNPDFFSFSGIRLCYDLFGGFSSLPFCLDLASKIASARLIFGVLATLAHQADEFEIKLLDSLEGKWISSGMD